MGKRVVRAARTSVLDGQSGKASSAKWVWELPPRRADVRTRWAKMWRTEQDRHVFMVLKMSARNSQCPNCRNHQTPCPCVSRECSLSLAPPHTLGAGPSFRPNLAGPARPFLLPPVTLKVLLSPVNIRTLWSEAHSVAKPVLLQTLPFN